MLKRYSECNNITNREILDRREKSKEGPCTTHFVSFEGGEDIAFVSLNFDKKQGCLVLYELYIPSTMRCRGIGGAVLSEVEQIAASLNFNSVRLYPRPLDESVLEGWLIDWYGNRGYKPVNDGTGEMEKYIVG